MEIKRTLCSLITSLVMAVNAHGAMNLPKGYEFFDKANYYRFNRDITVSKISKNKKIGWFVYDTENQDIIGDEEYEIGGYRKYATMAESRNIMDALTPENIREMASLYRRGLAGYEIIYNIPNFIVEEGSKLEGLLLRRYFGGGKDLPEDVQKKIVKEIINNEKKEIVDKFYQKIFGDEKELNPLEAAEKVREFLLNTIEARMLDASSKLDHAAEILERGKRKELTYEEYTEFINNFIEGNCTGRAYLNAIDNIKKNVSWSSITQKIAKNLADGLGIKGSIEDVSIHVNDLLDVDLASIIFGSKDFMDVFNDVERMYVEERTRLFKSVEGRYNLEKGTISNQIITDLRNKEILNKISDKEQIINIFESGSKALNRGDITYLENIVDKHANPAYYEHTTRYMRNSIAYCKNSKNKIISIQITDISNETATAIVEQTGTSEAKYNPALCPDTYQKTRFSFIKRNNAWKIADGEVLETKTTNKK